MYFQFMTFTIHPTARRFLRPGGREEWRERSTTSTTLLKGGTDSRASNVVAADCLPVPIDHLSPSPCH
jgi:hypothetical protein